MGPDYRIRRAVVSDLDDLERIALGIAGGTWRRNTLESEMKLAWSRVEILDEGRKTRGFMVWWHTENEIELQVVATDAEQRRRGVATVLMRHLLESARALGVSRVMLEVQSSNEAARTLYDKLGFVVVGVRPRYYGGEDAVLMDWACH